MCPAPQSHNPPFSESSVGCGRSRRKNGNFDARRKPFRTVEALRGLHIVLRFGEEDIGDERLRVAVIQREPGGLHLHHDPVPRQEHVVDRWQDELVRQWFVRHDRLVAARLSRGA